MKTARNWVRFFQGINSQGERKQNSVYVCVGGGRGCSGNLRSIHKQLFQKIPINQACRCNLSFNSFILELIGRSSLIILYQNVFLKLFITESFIGPKSTIFLQTSFLNYGLIPNWFLVVQVISITLDISTSRTPDKHTGPKSFL